MQYYKDKNTGEVYAYSNKDLLQVKNLSADSPQVFHNIQRKLSGMVELIGEELDLHLNPPPTLEQLAAQGRAERDSALSVLDAFVTNPLRYSELTEEQKVEAKVYRQELLDLPQQVGFPSSYIMPKVPKWIN